jgi:hypothetical protein
MAALNFLTGTTQGWQYKILLAPPVVFYNEFLGGDSHIVLAFYAVFFMDLFVGVASAVKRQVFSRKRLGLWTVKLTVNTMCILLIGLLDVAFVHALHGFHVPILDIVVSIMLAGEVASIFANLQELTGRVPPFLMRATAKIQHRASKRFEAALDAGDDEDDETEEKERKDG